MSPIQTSDPDMPVEQARSPIGTMTLLVGFDNRQVLVETDNPYLLDELEHFYRLMMADEAGSVVATLQARREGSSYSLYQDHQIITQDIPSTAIVRSLIHEINNCLIAARPNLLWFHAGAAASVHTSVLLPGLPGRGKSTLVGHLCMQGWRYLSDEIAPLDYTTGRVMAYPQMPWMRKDIGEDIPESRLYELQKTAIAVAPDMVCRQAVPIGAVICPDFKRDAAPELVPCSPATAVLKLLQSCVNFAEHQERAIEYLRSLVLRIPVYTLIFSDGQVAARLLSDTLHDNL